MLGWLALAALPLRLALPRRLAVTLGVGIAMLYAALIGVFVTQGQGGFGSLAEVSQLFEHRGLLLAGWVHYLAFDLLVGAWEREEARRIGMPHGLLLPCLALTFLFGPAGWLLFMGLRGFHLRPAERDTSPHPGLAAALRGLPAEIHRRQPLLAAAAAVSLLAIVPCLIAMALDVRTVNDISVWVKPTKFLVSFVVYYATLAWVFGYLPASASATPAGRFVVRGPLLVGAFESVWLLSAAVAGVPAHFNFASPPWAVAYGVAGLGALVMITAILVQGLMVARSPHASLAPAVRTALVLGAVIAFGATLVTAGFMSAGSGHWVGGPPSDANGLALMGWARDGGDLRVAHFFALHAQQAIPIMGMVLATVAGARAVQLVWAGSAVYLGLIAFTFVQALRGQPFLAFLG